MRQQKHGYYETNKDKWARTEPLKYRKDRVPQLDRDTCLYLAGLFDGEGSFVISTTLYRGVATYNASARIAMTHRDVMVWIGEKLDRPIRVHSIGRNGSPKAKTCYRIVLQNASAIISFIEQVHPFLIVKRDAAATLLEFCKSRILKAKKYGKAKAYTVEEINLHARLRQLNRVGNTEAVH